MVENPRNDNKININSNTLISDLKIDSDPFQGLSFKVGVAENKNSNYRNKMEDVHTYIANFAERIDWGYFAIFDGHAGKDSARWCGNNLHTLLEQEIYNHDDSSAPNSNKYDMRDFLYDSFIKADELIVEDGSGSSGCTAAVAVLRWETDKNIDNLYKSNNPDDCNNSHDNGLDDSYNKNNHITDGNVTNDNKKHNTEDTTTTTTTNNTDTSNKTTNNETTNNNTHNTTNNDSTTNNNDTTTNNNNSTTTSDKKFDFIPQRCHKRVLYTANVGDSRIILYRNKKPQRLSYDHKATDVNEVNRIREKGGLIMKNRVNGVLAVTRSLGDSYMKDLVIGNPFTTCTEITKDDDFLILACDGVWDVISDLYACRFVSNFFKSDPNIDPQIVAKKLCQLAMDKLTTDNVTVMIVKFDKDVFNQQIDNENP